MRRGKTHRTGRRLQGCNPQALDRFNYPATEGCPHGFTHNLLAKGDSWGWTYKEAAEKVHTFVFNRNSGMCFFQAEAAEEGENEGRV